jgi:hypothetical protein
LKLTNQYRFYTSTHHLTETIGNAKNKANIGHVANKALLLTFFDESTLKFLCGDFLSNMPINVNLPTFQLYEHNMSDRLAADTKIKLSMDRAIQAVQRDETILNSISDRVVTGLLEIPNYWISLAGILQIVVSIVLIFLLINTAYVLFRLRTISIILAVLQASILKTEAVQDEIFLNYRTSISPYNNSLLEGKIQVVLLEATRGLWPYYVGALIGMVFLTYLWYNIYKQNCAPYQNNLEIILHLQFITGTSTVFVPISQPVYGIFDDFIMQGKKYVSNIQITGTLKPKLRFTWKSLFLINTLTGKRILIRESHKLSWTTAYRLKGLVRSQYAVLLVLIHAKEIKRIKPAYFPDGPEQAPDPNLLPVEALEFV